MHRHAIGIYREKSCRLQGAYNVEFDPIRAREAFAKGRLPDGTPAVGIDLRCIEGIDVDTLSPKIWDGPQQVGPRKDWRSAAERPTSSTDGVAPFFLVRR